MTPVVSERQRKGSCSSTWPYASTGYFGIELPKTQRLPRQMVTAPLARRVTECGRSRLVQEASSSSPTPHEMLRLGVTK